MKLNSPNIQLKAFQGVLEARVAELERGICRRDGIAIEQSPDQVDEIQRASDRALVICNLDREAHELRNARTALRRIEEGNFGICEQCEEQIHPKRLLALPWASLCIQCQEAIDSHRLTASPLPAESFLGNAA